MIVTATTADERPLLRTLLHRVQQVVDATRRSGTALGATGPVLQRSTATIESEPEPNELHQASSQRIRLYRTLLPTVHTEEVSGFNSQYRPPSGGHHSQMSLRSLPRS